MTEMMIHINLAPKCVTMISELCFAFSSYFVTWRMSSVILLFGRDTESFVHKCVYR